MLEMHDPEVAARIAASRRSDARAFRPFDSSAGSSSGADPAAGLPDHDHRLVPADGGGPRGARRASQAATSTMRITTRFCRRRSRTPCASQEELGLDVLVHGESERNDMVEYFGEQLDGFAFTQTRLGAELRLALREAADHLRRRVAARSR